MNLLGIANPKQKAIEIVQTGGAPTGFLNRDHYFLVNYHIFPCFLPLWFGL